MQSSAPLQGANRDALVTFLRQVERAQERAGQVPEIIYELSPLITHPQVGTKGRIVRHFGLGGTRRHPQQGDIQGLSAFKVRDAYSRQGHRGVQEFSIVLSFTHSGLISTPDSRFVIKTFQTAPGQYGTVGLFGDFLLSSTAAARSLAQRYYFNNNIYTGADFANHATLAHWKSLAYLGKNIMENPRTQGFILQAAPITHSQNKDLALETSALLSTRQVVLTFEFAELLATPEEGVVTLCKNLLKQVPGYSASPNTRFFLENPPIEAVAALAAMRKEFLFLNFAEQGLCSPEVIAALNAAQAKDARGILHQLRETAEGPTEYLRYQAYFKVHSSMARGWVYTPGALEMTLDDFRETNYH